jgi:ligand-binding sensor domain-containing protein
MQLTLFGILLLFQVFQSEPEHSILNRDGQNFDSFFFEADISRLIQDQDGLIWLGTNNGVISYDGYQSNYYSSSLLDTASQSFYGDYVNSLFEDSNGNIWAATAYGTFNVLPDNATTFINALDTHDEQVKFARSMIELENGYIMSNSELGFHFLSYDPETKSISHKIIEYATIGIVDPINMIKKTEDGEVLLLNDGIYRAIISDNFEFEIEKIIEGEILWHITELESGAYLYNDQSDLFVGFADGSKVELDIDISEENYIHSIFKDSKGKIWVGTDKQLVSFQLSSDYEVQHLRSFNIQKIRSILEDHSGNLFFGHQFRLFKLNWNYTDYAYIDLPEKYGNTYTYKFHVDIDGNYWVSHENGFLKYIMARGEFIEINDNRAHSINEDLNHNIWAGDDEGLKIYNPSTNEIIYDFENGDAWFINNGLIKRIKSGTNEIEEFSVKYNIRRFLLDGSDIWLHSNEFNLRKYQIADTGLVFKEEFLIDKPEYRFNWFEDDLHGNIWMSSGKGVVIISKESGEIVSIFNRENKLNGNDIFELIRDQKGIIWVKAASFGSTAIDPETFESVSFTPSWLTQPNSRGYYCVNAVGRNGELFTDGRGGFFVFHPDSIKKSEITPAITLLNTRVNDVDYDSDSSTLRYFQNDVDFEFTGIQFDNPERNEFSYFLEGFDEEWNNAGNERMARYLSLPPGSYTFYVQASNSDKVWSESVALASFRILPPWWANPIAYFIYVIVLGFIGYRFYQIQLNLRRID